MEYSPWMKDALLERMPAAYSGGARLRRSCSDPTGSSMRTRVAKKGATMASATTEHVTAGTPSKRLTSLPTYVFAWLDELKAVARARGAKLVDLGIGNPDRPTPKLIVDAIAAAYAEPWTH